MSGISDKTIFIFGRTFPVCTVSIILIISMIFTGCDNSDPEKEMDIKILYSHVQRLRVMTDRAEAVRAVKRIQRAYGHYAEFGMWDDLADLFAEDGIEHYPAATITRDNIRKYFMNEAGNGKPGLPEGVLHSLIMLEPVINVAADGKTAKGRWRLFSMLGTHGKRADWKGGVYENDYILEDGVWKISDLHYYPQYHGPYEQDGWNIDPGDIPTHYSPDQAGLPVLETAGTQISDGPFPDIKELSLILSDLMNRSERLNDEDEILNLQNIYGYYVDRKMWDDAVDLFTEDGTFESGLYGVHSGKENIRKAFEKDGSIGLKKGEINDHLQVQTIIDVSSDGMTARARGTEIVMSGKYRKNGEWGLGVFENEYKKRGGKWQIKSMHIYPRFRADYNKGWAMGAMPSTGNNNDSNPDRRSSGAFGLYPEYHIPPFHYNHPVTGNPPVYPEGAVLTGAIAFNSGSGGSSGTVIKNDTASIEELKNRAEEIERLLRKSIAFDACENLTSAYGYYIDDFNWDDFSDLFSVNGWREAPFVGVYTGRERIRKSLKIQYPGTGGRSPVFFTCHQLIQPVIHVSEDGGSADIRVRLFQLSGASGSNGLWMAGILEKKAVIEEGIWKLSGMDLDYTWTADYKGGWAKGPMSMKLSAGKILEEFPPDKPLRGPSDAPYPEIAEMPFHYVNPVSGRKPSLLLE